ncbi:hypothetical protein [Sulfurimonas autotrophica]|uniref:DUF3972 domain-containing protein n=1 Tax=Sulfurimonas autotrophica (strain ATCC BAA-671 / DSM 16294 / JCM 11897 / OK10) TaxID=563040 RepID=E0UPS6_SULAO|nr:hypothetical protein [Sulfurimonas autotrophica]ADN09735.1 conserved hypothetical protein [Sulfurimonas autotrophica DSM 16294]
MKLTLDEYSKKFKMSKEMINSKLRTKKLNYIVEDDTVYIIVPDEVPQKQAQPSSPSKSPAKPRTTVAMVLSLYQKENLQLKAKIVQLEEKIDKLIDDKEQMLRDEMSKIEKVYSTKDEQLKQVLELLNTKLLAQSTNTVHDVEPLPQTQKAIDVEEENKIVELKSYLKTLELEPYQRKIIKKRFLAVYDSDVRVIKQNGKLYLDFAKYDYSDLLEY